MMVSHDLGIPMRPLRQIGDESHEDTKPHALVVLQSKRDVV